MSGRVAPLGLLLAHEARLAWRAGGARRPLLAAGVAILWAALHVVAWRLTPEASPTALSSASLVFAGVLTLFAGMLVVASAFGLAIHALFERGDLEPVLASPVPARAAWAARGLVVAAGALATPAFLWLPFAHAAAWHGDGAWLAAYPVLAGAGLGATAIAIGLTVALVRAVGARRARVLAQVTGALAGAGLFLASQAFALLPVPAAAAIAGWMATPAGQAWAGPQSPLWWPARALLGEAIPALALVASGTVAFLLAVAGVARAHAVGALEPRARERPAAKAAPAVRFGRHLATTVLVKEWRLVARDPRALLQVLLPVLYLLPLAVIALRRPAGPGFVGPSAVLVSALLAGGLAWLAASGEESPDLLGSAPVARGRLEALKALSAIVPALALAAPVAAGLLAWRPIGEAAAFVACLLPAVVGAVLTQQWGARPGSRRDLVRRSQPGRLVGLVEQAGAAGWALACWALGAQSPWLLAGLAAGVGAPLLARRWLAREGTA